MRKITACVLALLGIAKVMGGPGPDADLIKNLPGCDLKVDAYSGYLTVTDTKKLHYVYIGSQDKPTSDPVVLWFNGGPGCSSLEGLFNEHGPCVIADGETDIKVNPFSWNTRANMVYIESPAGVGYSIATGEEDMIQTDMSQSQDLMIALKDFFVKFPTLIGNDLYVSGESYAGIYVPYLSW
jgi:carboxypeptidase C (cathepsin A)